MYYTNKSAAACVGFVVASMVAGCTSIDEPQSESVLQSATVTVTTRARPPLRAVSLSGAEWNTGAMYPTQSEIDYFIDTGMTAIRLPFEWARLQPTPRAPFAATEWAKLDAVVQYATGRGASVILDPHNFARYKGQILGTAGAPFSYFEDLWARLANAYKNNGRVIFGLMNEPYDIATEQWLTAANRAIAAIRAQGAANLVLVPGAGWDGAPSWFSNWYGTPNSVVMLGVVDPFDNYAYEFHQYFDPMNAGEGGCASIDIGVNGVRPVIEWLRAHGRRGFLGELGFERTNTCYAAAARLVRLVEQSTDVMLGWGVWAGGPRWGPSYPLNVEPLGGTHSAQMHALLPFLQPLARRGVILTGPEYGPVPGRAGIDYVYPTNDELDHFLGRGMTTIVLPLRWQRLQPTPRGPLAAAELARLDQTIAAINARGGTALLRLDGQPEAFGGVAGASLPDDVFADLWGRLATHYRNNARVAFGLASYAHDLTTSRWASAAQAAVTAVRRAGGHHLVVISGNGWSDAAHWYSTWYGASNATVMDTIVDAENNIAFDARLFVDTLGNGVGTACATPATVAARLAPFVDWLRTRGRRGFIGAFGGPGDSAQCLAALARGATEIEAAHDVLIGYAYSQAGPWSTDHPYSIEPWARGERAQWSSLAPLVRGLTAELFIAGAWSNGYCAEVSLRNEGAPPAQWSSVSVRIGNARLTASWDARVAGTTDVLTFTPDGSSTIASGELVKMGYCASHTGARPTPEIVSAN